MSTKFAPESDTVPAGSQTQDNIGIVDIDNQDLDEEFAALGDGKSDKDGDKAGDEAGDKKDAKPSDKDGDITDADDKDKAPAGEDVPTKYQGKSAKELLAILMDGEKFQGKQSSDVGEMRKMVEQLSAENKNLMAKLSGPEGAKDNAAPADPYAAKTAELEADLDTGKITPAEYAKSLAAMNELRTSQIVQSELQKAQAQSQEQAATSQYLEMNPDFTTLQQSGALDKIKAQFPVHDNVSAYEFAKRLEVQSENETLKGQIAALKKEQAEAIAAGKEGTKKVLQQPGTGTKVSTPQRSRRSFSEGEAVDSMLASMQRTRES